MSVVPVAFATARSNPAIALPLLCLGSCRKHVSPCGHAHHTSRLLQMANQTTRTCYCPNEASSFSIEAASSASAKDLRRPAPRAIRSHASMRGNSRLERIAAASSLVNVVCFLFSPILFSSCAGAHCTHVRHTVTHACEHAHHSRSRAPICTDLQHNHRPPGIVRRVVHISRGSFRCSPWPLQGHAEHGAGAVACHLP